MAEYKSYRFVDEKARWVIVDKNGKIINRKPSKEELKDLEKEPCRPRGYYNEINTCEFIETDGERCNEKLCPGNARRFNINENIVWYCERHSNRYRQKYDPNSRNNIQKLLRNCRTGNQNPNSNQAKGDKSQELACMLYGWEDLNKKYDNYMSPVDCYDPKTGLYHQVQIRYYNPIESSWPFTCFERERKKIFEDMICFCISEDGNIVERMYKFPKGIIDDRGCARIYKYNSIGRLYKYGWYKEYRIKNENKLKEANEIWKNIIDN